MKDLGDIFQRSGKDFYGNNFVTITEVKMTPDLGLAKIYVSILGSNDKEEIVTRLNNRKSEVRGILGNRIGKQVRIIPDIRFYLDDSLDRVDKMDQIFKDLNIPPDNE